ncbi:MAG: PIG-L deacetylase family protein [Anaerolineaceae bacterium]|jgi:LmbE family N-acetylglucosaminyl deacetylase
MKLTNPNAEIYVPDGTDVQSALQRTTHMAISAHQDDIEIMAAGPIVECFQQSDKWFTGVVVTDGRGSPRDGVYKAYTDDEMMEVRRLEQKKAALVGGYSAQVLMNHPSAVVKDPGASAVVDDLVALLRACKPEVLYVHNLADKHETHVAVVLRVISALRRLDKAEQPRKLIGCEVWRNLDWMADKDKVVMDVSHHENLQEALLGVFDSQIAGGKRYDLATMGRRRGNATFFASHGTDQSTGLWFGMDLTPLMQADVQPDAFIKRQIARFEEDVVNRLKRLNNQ